MALTVTTPVPMWAATTSGSSTVTSASFSVTAGDLLIVGVSLDASAGPFVAPTNSGATSFTFTARANGGTSGPVAFCGLWTAPVTASQTITIQLSRAGGDEAKRWGHVWVVSSQHGSPIGVSGGSQANSVQSHDPTYTATAAGSVTFVASNEYNERGVPVSTNLTKKIHGDYPGWTEGFVGHKVNRVAGSSSFNLKGFDSSAGWSYAYLEILPARGTPVLESYAVSTTNTTVNKPSGVVAGDTLVYIGILSTANTSGPTKGTVAGFTYRGESMINPPGAANNNGIYIYDRVADGSEGSTFSMAGFSASYQQAVCLRLSGAGAFGGVTPIYSVGSGTTATIPAITPPAGSLALAAHATWTASYTPTTPAGWTSAVTWMSGTQVLYTQEGTGATIGPTNFTLSGSETGWTTYAWWYEGEASAFSPVDVPNLVGWWEASDAASFTYSSGTTVSQWNDKGPNNAHLTASAGVTRNETLNGKSVVAFANGYLSTAASAFANVGQPHTQIVVVRSELGGQRRVTSGVSSGGAGFYRHAAGNMRWYAGTSHNQVLDNGWHVLGGIFNGASSTQRVDGVQVGTTNTGTIELGTAFKVGANLSDGDPFTGAIAEVIVYNASLTADELDEVEDYLRNKWLATPVVASFATDPSGSNAVAKPSGVVAGDKIVIGVYSYPTSDVDYTPAISGFTLRAQFEPAVGASTGRCLIYILDRVSDGTEGSTFSQTGISDFVELVALRVSGAGKFHLGGTQNGNLTTSGNLQDLTVGQNSSLALGFVAGYSSTRTISSAPSGWTQVVQFSDVSQYVFRRDVLMAGAVADTSFTWDSAEQWSTVTCYYEPVEADWTPDSLSNTVSWYDAADPAGFTFYSGSLVQQWNDLSGNARHLTTGSSTVAPVRSKYTLNGFDTVAFDGVDNYLRHDGTDMITVTSFSVVALVRMESFVGTNDRVVSFKTDGANDNASASSAVPIMKKGSNFPVADRNGTSLSTQSGFLGGWAIISSIFDGASHTMYVNGVAKTPVSSSGTFNIDEMWFGAQSTLADFGNVTFAEIIVTSDSLDATERSNVWGYLYDKWLADDPLTMIPWNAAFWAEDSAITAPDNGADVAAWNQPGSYQVPPITVHTSGSNNTTATQTFTSASFTPAANSKLYMFAYGLNTSSVARDWSCSGGGLTWTKDAESPFVDAYWDSNSKSNVVLYSADVGPSPSSMTVTVDANTTTANVRYSWTIFSVVGGSLVQAITTAGETESGAANETLTVSLGSAATSRNLVLACFGAHQDPTAQAFGVPSGWNVLVDQTLGYQHVAVFTKTDFTGTSVTCPDLGNATGASGAVMFELNINLPSWEAVSTPTFVSNWQNGRSAIDFLQGERLIAAYIASFTSPVTVAIVGETTATHADLCDNPTGAGTRLMIDRYAPTSKWRYYGGSPGAVVETALDADSLPHLFLIHLTDTTANYFKIDGSVVATGVNAGPSNSPSIALGSSAGNTQHVESKIAFAGVISRELTVSEQGDLLAWYQDHYAIEAAVVAAPKVTVMRLTQAIQRAANW